jgi:PAS domain S-box-containing protein
VNKEELPAAGVQSVTHRSAARKSLKQNARLRGTTSQCRVRSETTALLDQEQRIIQRNEFSDLVIESLVFPYLVIDAHNYTIRKANSAAGLGELPKDVPCYKIFHNKDQPCQSSDLICPVEEVRKNGTSCVLEHLHFDEKGKVVKYAEIHAHPVYDPDGKLAQVVTCTIDKTEHKKTDISLRESVSKCRSIFESIPIGISLVSFEGDILWCNAAMSNLTGYPEAQLATMNITELLQSRKEYEPIGERLKTEEGFIHDGEARLVRKDGSPLYARFTVSRFAMDGSMVVLVSVIDISQRKNVEAELEKSLKTLKQKNITLTEFAEQIEIEKIMMKEEINANIRELVFPLLEKLRLSQAPSEYLDLLEHRLREIAEKYGITIAKVTATLSPRETEICTLIQSGLTSKEIAQLLGVSYQTVEKHRRNIRRKLGLSGKKLNLASHLRNGS